MFHYIINIFFVNFNFFQVPENNNNTKHDLNNLKLVKKNVYIEDVEIYNKLMFSLAKNGQTSKIIRLFDKMRSLKNSTEQSLKPNLNSYVAAIQSIGHNLSNDKKLSVDKAHLILIRIMNDLRKSNVIYCN
jgi:pentatricopeptide repeat protein